MAVRLPKIGRFRGIPGGTYDVIEPGRHDRAPVVEYPGSEHPRTSEVGPKENTRIPQRTILTFVRFNNG